MSHCSNNALAIPVKPGTESYVVDYGFLARARMHRGPTTSSTTWPGSGSTDSNSLKYLLKAARVNAAIDDKQTFLPLGKLDALCNRVAVRKELLALNDSQIDIDHYVNYVCGDPGDNDREEHVSRKIFAILVLIDKLHTITTFFREGIRDRHLPFRKSTTGYNSKDFALMRRSTLDQSDPQMMGFFDDWNSVDKTDFYQTQWQLLSPFFGKAPEGSAALYKLDDQTIMPWVSIDAVKYRAYVPLENFGGYSKVKKVVIHEDHHSFGTKDFAIKELFDEDEGPFENEFDNLKKVQTRKHLLPVHAAYVCGNRYSFIFPWANGGSLDDLWKIEPRSLIPEPEKDFHELVKWVAGQLSGLTGEFGLGFLHGVGHLEPSKDFLVPGEKPFGIHGDIKPSNILYFKQDAGHGYLNSTEDLLKISDFGLTGFHSARTRSRLPATGPHSPTYRSPEWGRNGVDEGFLSRKYDIWSLGCVFLEFLTWFIGGPEALQQFTENRKNDKCDTGTKFCEDKFFVIDGDKRYIKHSVTQCAENLKSHAREGSYLHDCLRLIMEKMLLIADDKRANCIEVHRDLEKYNTLCSQDDEYLKIDISMHYKLLPRESFRRSNGTVAHEPPRPLSPSVERSGPDPTERQWSHPPITFTDPHSEDFDRISPHTVAPSVDVHNRQLNLGSEEDHPALDQLSPSPSRDSVRAASTSPIVGSILNESPPSRRPVPPETDSSKWASFTRRISKWLCFS